MSNYIYETEVYQMPRNDRTYKRNSYCPRCGSNCVGSDVFDVNLQEELEQCDECQHIFYADARIQFFVDTSQRRPDPMMCGTCVYRGNHVFPWIEGPCKDLPFWVMPLRDTGDDGIDHKYKNEVTCSCYQQQETNDD